MSGEHVLRDLATDTVPVTQYGAQREGTCGPNILCQTTLSPVMIPPPILGHQGLVMLFYMSFLLLT